MLSHWIVIENGKIKNYQAVVPSTWNAGPRDDDDAPGPYEASLVDNPVADAEQAAGSAAHGALLRSVHRLRDPPGRYRSAARSSGEGVLDVGRGCRASGNLILSATRASGSMSCGGTLFSFAGRPLSSGSSS